MSDDEPTPEMLEVMTKISGLENPHIMTRERNLAALLTKWMETTPLMEQMPDFYPNADPRLYRRSKELVKAVAADYQAELAKRKGAK